MAFAEIMAGTRNVRETDAYVQVTVEFEGLVADHPPANGVAITAAPATITWDATAYTTFASFQTPTVANSEYLPYATKAHSRLRVIYRGSRLKTG